MKIRWADGPGGGFLNIHLTPNYNKFITLCWPVTGLEMGMWTNPGQWVLWQGLCDDPQEFIGHLPQMENSAKHNG